MAEYGKQLVIDAGGAGRKEGDRGADEEAGSYEIEAGGRDLHGIADGGCRQVDGGAIERHRSIPVAAEQRLHEIGMAAGADLRHHITAAATNAVPAIADHAILAHLLGGVAVLGQRQRGTGLPTAGFEDGRYGSLPVADLLGVAKIRKRTGSYL